MSFSMVSESRTHIGHNMTVVWASVLFLSFMAKTGHCDCLHPEITPTFYSASSHTFQGHVYHMKMASSVVICGRDCSIAPQCASFNYFTSSRICELNNNTRLQSQWAFVKMEGSVYFDKNYETSFLPAPSVRKYTSCLKLLRAGFKGSGIYTIHPSGIVDGLQVYCDMETDEGGWIVFQRREDGSVDFYRNWTDYQTGFGNLSGEFWLGNDILRNLTESEPWQLRVELGDWEGGTAWTQYGRFRVFGQQYTLDIGAYNTKSTAGDSLTDHNTYPFTTQDQDNDVSAIFNCAQIYWSAWWFKSCFNSNLNGQYHCQQPDAGFFGLQWKSWKTNQRYSLKHTEMKIRENQ